jgi:hypothetical protein
MAPPELIELRFSDAELKAGADPLDADFEAPPSRPARLAERDESPSAANLAEHDRPARLAEHTNGSAMGSVGAARLAERESPSAARLADELSCIEEKGIEVQEGSPARLAALEAPAPFAGRRRVQAGPRSAADVFAVEQATP